MTAALRAGTVKFFHRYRFTAWHAPALARHGNNFQRGTLPATLAPYRKKIFGLSIHPDRLSEVRNERRPGSKYATIEQCRMEVAEAERLMRMEGIPWLSTTTKSIEEISTKILDDVGLDRRSY